MFRPSKELRKISEILVSQESSISTLELSGPSFGGGAEPRYLDQDHSDLPKF